MKINIRRYNWKLTEEKLEKFTEEFDPYYIIMDSKKAREYCKLKKIKYISAIMDRWERETFYLFYNGRQIIPEWFGGLINVPYQN